jgi:hypothetical protein
VPLAWAKSGRAKPRSDEPGDAHGGRPKGYRRLCKGRAASISDPLDTMINTTGYIAGAAVGYVLRCPSSLPFCCGLALGTTRRTGPASRCCFPSPSTSGAKAVSDPGNILARHATFIRSDGLGSSPSDTFIGLHDTSIDHDAFILGIRPFIIAHGASVVDPGGDISGPRATFGVSTEHPGSGSVLLGPRNDFHRQGDNSGVEVRSFMDAGLTFWTAARCS